MKFNRTSFFSCFRAYHKAERNKNLTQSQVDGLTFLLDRIEHDATWVMPEQIAYFLATIAHETAWTFEPIKEYRSKTLSAAQKKYWPSGFYGRGYVQLTWENNYRKAGERIGVDLAAKPDLALEPRVAYQIAALGMTGGWFTGKALSHYINSQITDYKNARRIVNGLDKASHIAGIAQAFEKCLRSSVADSGETVSDKGADEGDGLTPAPTPPVSTPDPTVLVPQATPSPAEEPKVSGLKTQWAALTTFVTASAGSIITWLSGARAEIIIGLAVIVTVIGGVYMITRYFKQQKAEVRAHEEKMQRERQAHEVTIMQMKSAMDKDANTVRVVPKPLESSDSQ